MTLKNLYLNLMKEDVKRRLFIPAITLVIFFFWFPVSILISFVPQTVMFYDTPEEKESFINSLLLSYDGLCNNRGLTFVMIALLVIAAFTGFNYLFKSNKADFLHGIPVNRRILFLVYTIDGFLMVYLPMFLMSVIGTIFMAMRTGKADPFLSLFSCIFYNLTRGLLCYACAIIAIMFTGNIISAFLGLMYVFFYITLILFSIIGMQMGYFATYYTDNIDHEKILRYSSAFIYSMMDSPEGLAEMVISAFVTLFIGFIVLFVSYLLYERRAIETAGKAIAFKKVEAPIKFSLVIPAAICGAVVFENVASLPTAVFGFICALLISHCVMEVIFNSDFRKLFSHPIQMLICGFLGMLIYLGFFFDVLGYDSFIPSKALIKDSGLYCNVLESNMSELNVKLSRDKSDHMYGDYNNGFEVDLVEKMKITDTDTVIALARNGISHTKKNKLSLKNLFSGHYDQEDMVNPVNLVICYHLKGGIKIFREYTIDGYELVSELDSIHDNKEFKNAVYPILNSTWEDYAAIYCQDMSGERRISASDDKCLKLLENYKAELSTLTMNTRRKEQPIACLHFVNNEYLEYLSSKYSDEHYMYYEFSDAGYYPVYPSFAGTVSAMKECGCMINQDILSAGIDHVDLRFDANDSFSINEKNYMQELYDSAVPNLKYKNDICPVFDLLELSFYLRDFIMIYDPQISRQDDFSYTDRITNISVNAKRIPEFLKDNFELRAKNGISCRDYAFKKPDPDDPYNKDYIFNEYLYNDSFDENYENYDADPVI